MNQIFEVFRTIRNRIAAHSSWHGVVWCATCASQFHNLMTSVDHYFLASVETAIFKIRFTSTLQMEAVYSSETQPPDY